MTQEIKKDMILHRIAERMERNVRMWGRNCSLPGIQLFPAWETNVPSVGARLCRFACRRTNSSLKGHFLRSLLLLLMLVGASEVWGQEGIWYIANGKQVENSNNQLYYDKNDPTVNFYLCPAQYYYNPEGSGTNVVSTTNNTGFPFLTTYKTNQGDNSIWIIEKVKNKSTYYIKHIGVGDEHDKYLIKNPSLKSSGLPNVDDSRLRVHLEEKAKSELDTDAEFEITPYGSDDNIYYGIRISTINSGWLNPSKGNRQAWGPDGTANIGGIIGYYTGKAPNVSGGEGSKWHFENAKLSAPTITVDNSNQTFTITAANNNLPTGCEIRYTTGDGSQAVPTATTETEYTGTLYSSAVTVPANSYTHVKAAIVGHGVVMSEVKDVPVKCATPTLVYDSENQTVTLACATTGSTIYYRIGDTGDYTQYIDPLDVENGNVIYAYATMEDCLNSDQMAPYTVRNVCAIPTININYNADGTATVSMNCETVGAIIRYTTDGSDPVESTTATYPGDFANPVTSGMTIKAIATKDGFNPSAVASATVEQVAMPVIEIVNNEITISCATVGAAIYYTIGDETTPHAYTNSLELSGNISGEAIHAYATKDSYLRSSITTFYLPVLLPVITYDPETNKVVITCVVEGVSIKYTTGQTETDAGNPTTVYTDGAAGFDLPDYHHVIKAIAVKTSTGEHSEVASLTILIQPTTDDNNPRPYLIQSVECTDFYMIPGDSKGVNTSSLGRPSMEWCFYYAGKSAGSADAGEEYDYYYIKNKQTNEYIYYIWAMIRLRFAWILNKLLIALMVQARTIISTDWFM